MDFNVLILAVQISDVDKPTSGPSRDREAGRDWDRDRENSNWGYKKRKHSGGGVKGFAPKKKFKKGGKFDKKFDKSSKKDDSKSSRDKGERPPLCIASTQHSPASAQPSFIRSWFSGLFLAIAISNIFAAGI